MHVIPFLNADQKDFIRTVERLGSTALAVKYCKVPKDRYEEWQTDPDFRLALDDVVGRAEAAMYAKAVEKLHDALDAGHVWAVDKVLSAINPELWNPALRIQVEPPKHRFISFDGKDLHTGEEFNPGALNGTTAQEGSAISGND